MFTANIKQIWRQILIDPSHCTYQRILNEPVHEYQLKTVIYGVTSVQFINYQGTNKSITHSLLKFCSLIFNVVDLVSGTNCLTKANYSTTILLSLLNILKARTNLSTYKHQNPHGNQIHTFSAILAI